MARRIDEQISCEDPASLRTGLETTIRRYEAGPAMTMPA